jgi:RimJ/RimL family protein N-acetyltransferase
MNGTGPSRAFEEVWLRGARVRLEPLSRAHVPQLCEVGLDPELWRVTSPNITSQAEMEGYVCAALEARAAGTALPFATIFEAENRVIGSTRFANYDPGNRRVEIGWTWIAPPWQRSGANVEAKLLMLAHAFEVLGCNRVEFKTDAVNVKSRAALRGIGAQEEGTLRSHMVLSNGRIRDSVYFSVIREEWPRVRGRLEERLKS